MGQLTELQDQAGALSVLSDVVHRAAIAGVPQHIAPTWCVMGDRITGRLRSADDSALHALDAWLRLVLGVARIEVTTDSTPSGPRRVWTMTTVIADVSIDLSASIPTGAAPRHQAVAA
ncbi:hypothetical protein ACIQF6_14940 [Kitasatospora sp. NPDC092948]|uniref:hypothetical protein n=1 Tax=Kitasatospora sp. NPDC092948 TaxID=3364088 RepID=UPI0037F6BF8B